MAKNNSFLRIVVLFLTSFTAAAVYDLEQKTTIVHRRFDFRQSLKAPYLTQAKLRLTSSSDIVDSQHSIPHFELGGRALVDTGRVRLTQGTPNERGSAWCLEPNPHREWQLNVVVKVTGPPARRQFSAGGEGFALWYAKDPIAATAASPVLGGSDEWAGLVVAFLTVPPQRSPPFIYGFATENLSTPVSLTRRVENPPEERQEFLGKCHRDYRNAPHNVHLRVTYAANTLTFEMDLNQNGQAFSECFRKDNVELPIGYHFGISASTTAYEQDDHDLISFELYELNPLRKKDQKDEEVNNGLPEDPEEVKQINEAEALIKKIEAQDTVKEPVPKGFEDAFNPATILSLIQGQEQIINSLNMVRERFGQAPLTAARSAGYGFTLSASHALVPLGAKTDDVFKKIEAMMTRADEISENVQFLIKSIQAAHARVNDNIQRVEKLVSSQDTQLVETAGRIIMDDKKQLRSWFVYGGFFAVGGVAFYALSVVVRVFRRD
ncbi:hypothetical protein HK100_008394 [Physocladia obscura]|uniref:L-type lectin-like domain-containing protein n=1 Tax=Physocladia obscura TaxID=109957 RepID=A0AAD5T6W9_9FUNG|nr:hypothetical protein HK100_008394 [Physocladia obscura]